MRTLVVAAILGSATIAAADARSESRRHFMTGKAAHDAGRYDEAIAEYQAAYDLAPLPELLFDLAQVHRLAGHKQLAVEMYDKYLATEPTGPGVAEAKEHRDQLAKELEDGKPATPVEDRPDPIAPHQPLRPHPIEAPDDHGRGLRIGGGIAVAVGVVAAIVAVKYGLDARSDTDKIQQLPQMWDPVAYQHFVDDGDRANAITIGAWITAGVAITGGVVMYVMGRSAEPAPLAVVPVRGGATIGWAARF